MKLIIPILFSFFLFFGCAKKPQVQLENTPDTILIEDDFSNLVEWDKENFDEVLALFLESCQNRRTQELYGRTCQKAQGVTDAKSFLQEEFLPYKIKDEDEDARALLTGYYEPFIQASLEQNESYAYPIYKKPKDLITVDLSSVYPELKNYRLRGRVDGDKLVPYYSRQESKERGLDADILCYCNSKIDRFFLEIQGSGRVILDDNSTMFIGFENQNGRRYRSIGRYLVEIGALKLEEVSLQSIRRWLEENPSRIDEVLNYNNSMVFFEQREQGATGAMGIELTPKRSIAVDNRYIPLGSMLYLTADLNSSKISRVAFAQDTGGAIKGAVRADLFVGSGEKALELAGRLKAPLNLWILLPKKKAGNSI